MKDKTTLQISKATLENLDKSKLQYEAKAKRRMTYDEYIQELIK